MDKEFKRPESPEEFQAARQRIAETFATIMQTANNRIEAVRTHQTAYQVYVDSCPECRGLGWTWHCQDCQSRGVPPNIQCLHFSPEERAKVYELILEDRFLDQVQYEIAKAASFVMEVEDPELAKQLFGFGKSPSN